MRHIPFMGRRPSKGHELDAAYDLRAQFDSLVQARGTTIVPTGLVLDIPERYVGLICSRSGLALNHGIFVLNAPGVIDPGYQGEICVILASMSDSDYRIAAGNRIAQLLILKTANVRLSSTLRFNESSRGIAGFGSTGKD